jgi:hypothetical protein
MNRRLLCIPLLFLVVLGARGQERLLIGPTLGYEFSVPLLLQRTAGAINFEYDFPGTGESYSHTAILGGQLVAPRAWSGALGYSARVALHGVTSNFTSDRFVPGLNLDTANQAGIDPMRYRTMAVDVTAVLLSADAQVRASLGETVVGGAGLWSSYQLSAQFLRTERPQIIPPDIPVEDVTIVMGGDRIGYYEVGYGAVFSLGALVPINSRTTLFPEITSRLDAVGLRRGLGFQAFTIGAGVSLLFDGVDAPPVVVEAPDPREHDTQPPESLGRRELRLEARVDLYADGAADRSQAVVEQEEVVNRYYIALPRTIPFARNAFDIAGGFTKLTREEAARFSLRTLAGLDPHGHYRHILNVLGHRLRESDSTTLVVTGVATAEEPPSLATVRGEFVRDYLVGTWGISPRRITMRAQHGTGSQVVLGGSSSLFDRPLLSQWKTRRYRMPQVGLERAVIADAGVRRWTLELSHGERVLARYTSDSSDDDPALDLKFLATGDSAKAIAPIVATLTVEDSLGRTTVTTDRLAVVRSAAAPAATQRERLEIITFDNALDSTSAAAARRLAAVRAARLMHDGATVSIGALGRVHDAMRRARSLEIARAAEDLLAAANERGVRIERFIAERDPSDVSELPGALRITIDQARGADDERVHE